MADDGNGDNSNHGPLSNQEKVLRNKRKYLAEFPREVPIDGSLSLTEFPRYELLAEKFENTSSDPGSLESPSVQPKEEREVAELHLGDWDDPITCQLEELLSHNLSAAFQSAIKKIAENGYSEEVAEWAILRSSLYHGSKDPVSNVVEGALVILTREKEHDTSRHHMFEGLENLVEYTMLELICMVREIKPSLTISEVMWFLLICDLNLSQACAVGGGDLLSGFGGKETSGENSSDSTLAQLKSEAQTSEIVLSTRNNMYTSKPSLPNTQNLRSEIPTVGGISNSANPMYHFVQEMTTAGNEKCLGIAGQCVQSMCQSMDEKSGSSKKGCLANSKRDMLRQKSFHLEKHYKGHVSKGTLRAKLTTWSGLVVDKKLKSPSDPSAVYLKHTCSKTRTSVKVNIPGAEASHHISSNTSSAPLLSKDTVSASPNAPVPRETKPTPKPSISIPVDPASPKISNYYSGIPYDESLGKYVPQDEKDKLIMMLVPQLQKLQKELQGWTDWANQKVMQAARRLSKDQAELKTLRQEREETEKFKKDKQIMEDTTVKRLSEMEYALANATSQVEMANSTISRLEGENSILQKEMKAIGLQGLGSTANLEAAFLREKEALKRAQSGDTEKSLLQEELSTAKHNVDELQHLVEKAKRVCNQVEAQRKQEEKLKEKILNEASFLRKEREQLDSLANAEEDKIRRKAENEMQKYKETIEQLESKISALRLKVESSKIAALKRGINGSYVSYSTNYDDSSDFTSHQAHKGSDRSAEGNYGARSARTERECVMCLTEEISVVFVPCAHQALCANCNELHEKQGMSDCPSCRTPIKRRIQVQFASP